MTRWFSFTAFFIAAALSEHWFPMLVLAILACRELDAELYEWSCKHRHPDDKDKEGCH